MQETYKLPQGKITISECNKNMSVGSLELNPGQELTKHNRPVNEMLTQLSGTSVMKLFDGDMLIKEVKLKENNTLEIPANQYHIHSNPNKNPSITKWQFQGDIVEIIENIRNSFERI